MDAGPFVLILAPNGAITGHFHGLSSLADVERSFVSPTMAGLLKAIQGSKVIFLRALNDESSGRAETNRSTDAVSKLLKGSAAVVTLDPASDEDSTLVGMLGLKPPLNGTTHDSRHAREWLESKKGRVRFHLTPTAASWLNQGELALTAFSGKYLPDRVWTSRDEFPGHVDRSIPHYNHDYAHRFDWSFTRDRFRERRNRSTTSSTGH